MIKSKKAIELSINMLVVIILGIVILGVGISAFYKMYNKVGGLNEQVDGQTQVRLNALLDDGSPIVVLMNTKDGDRGDPTDFSLAVNNNLLGPKNFTVIVTYGGTTANYESGDPFNPITNVNQILSPCTGDPSVCGNSWILGGNRQFELGNNERAHFPVRITIPKKDIRRGQYIFNVDVCVNGPGEGTACELNPSNSGIQNRFSSRQKIYVTIN